ncbi:MAG: Zn-ribbon domain-containing OB-fold protein [Caldilineaceae bacterium]|nr:Zn-ribbon domain-containing OB-fold protein [Caldilineaceae bacterium]
MGEMDQQTRPLSGTGTIYSFSIMYSVPQGFEEQKPYVIAIVQLDEGPMVTAQLTDINQDDVAIGQRVEMVTRKLREEGTEGQIIYGYKFRPALQDSISR